MNDIIIRDEVETTQIESHGSIKIWRVNFKTGEKELLVNKPNTILYQGADILAAALVGQNGSQISHFYVGYNISGGFSGDATAVDKTTPAFRKDANFGYLRIPLTYPASFFNDPSYSNNIPIFSILLSNAATYTVAGSPTFNTSAKIFEIGLVAASTGDITGDKVFSRARFTPITNDPSYNLTLAWGVRFTA